MNSTILFLLRYAIMPTGVTTKASITSSPVKYERNVYCGCCLEMSASCAYVEVANNRRAVRTHGTMAF